MNTTPLPPSTTPHAAHMTAPVDYLGPAVVSTPASGVVPGAAMPYTPQAAAQADPHQGQAPADPSVPVLAPYPLGATHYPAVPDPVIARPLVGERVALPSGGWVQLRHTDDLRSRHRSHVMAVLPMAAEAFDMGTIARMQRAVAEVMIVAWSLPYAPEARIPSLQTADPETGEGSSFDELTIRDEDVVVAKLQPVMDLLTPRKVDPADHEDPTSPTGPDGASGHA